MWEKREGKGGLYNGKDNVNIMIIYNCIMLLGYKVFWSSLCYLKVREEGWVFNKGKEKRDFFLVVGEFLGVRKKRCVKRKR